MPTSVERFHNSSYAVGHKRELKGAMQLYDSRYAAGYTENREEKAGYKAK